MMATLAGARAPRTRFVLPGLLVLAMCGGLLACAPAVPPYPFYGPYGSAQGVIDEANARSARLEQYVKDYLDGKVGAQVPADLVPEARAQQIPGAPTTKQTYFVRRANEIDANKQWGRRERHSINWWSSLGNFNDPHASYRLGAMLVPFGSKVTIEGDFPRARYFSIQMLPSFKPENYRYGFAGEGETSWLDADIIPNAGSTNPYKVGAARKAASRSFTLTCDVKVGDPAVTDVKSFTVPDNRNTTSNHRACSGMVFRGPWGDAASTDGDKMGLWAPGEMWLRVYAPDKDTDAFGNAGPPKVTYQLPDGRKYFIETDNNPMMNALNTPRALNLELPSAPNPIWKGAGWDKQFSIFRSVYGAFNLASLHAGGPTEADQRKYVRDLDKGVAGKGEDLPGIASHEAHATGGVHIHYMNKTMCLEAGKTFTLAGKLPTVPNTRGGAATMTAAQSRYWSLTGYSIAIPSGNQQAGAEITSVMDDEITTKNGNYVLMYSRPLDRPANATAANGVTWIDWGPEACQSFTLRWITVGPEWTFAKAPDQRNLGWETTVASASYVPDKLGRNHRNGFLGDYQPVATYLYRWEFEWLGNGFNPLTLPQWK